MKVRFEFNTEGITYFDKEAMQQVPYEKAALDILDVPVDALHAGDRFIDSDHVSWILGQFHWEPKGDEEGPYEELVLVVQLNPENTDAVVKAAMGGKNATA